MNFEKTTEKDSNYDNLENMSINEIITNINNEDKTVPIAVEKALPHIKALIEKVVEKLQKGGRLFYIGAGTSGRLGILDASECPPTFGVPHDLVIGLIAGGDNAIRKAVENAEDSLTQGYKDLLKHNISNNDIVIGIAASGTTPYVVSTLMKCNDEGIVTGCITCNKNSPLSLAAQFPIEVIVGPEFVTGSSRMKAGTAQKLVLNMITTSSMIRLGKIKGNKMVDMQLSNNKLVNRGTKMIIDELNISETEAQELLNRYGSVRKVIQKFKNGRDKENR
ncbi:MAG: N-acetylmuramic acid 6-phosphate etherase [Winogradskyella sp.]|uniref:N-acetylmuramic acid 6-phosphate etherase n=1 Tax=Winogradskyella sp. TaxID=1883156 RepID=UPI000F3D01A5|nr:N-acetylmuramic acid 6-phosphate etherase [Winogradskyella sp.]RNC79792.1 MAG: N-acetylmuramic acid 6-phosphate etherase [Winogradskyella sp.]